MDLEFLTQALFAAGTIVLAFAFAATVGHAVLLANGRRALAAAAGAAGALVRVRSSRPGPASPPARSSRRARPPPRRVPRDFAAPSPLSSAARWLTLVAFGVLLASMVIRGVIVGRGPWGNLFEFSVAFATSILFGYLVLARRYPIRSIAFIPVGVALTLALYASSLPHDDQPARAGAPERAAAHDPRRAGGPLVRDLRDVVRGRHRLPRPGQGRPLRVAAVAPGARFGRLPRGDHRLPDLRHDDHPRLVVGLDRLVPLLGLGPEGDRGARDLARLRDLPPRPQPARLGGPARRRCCSSSGS